MGHILGPCTSNYPLHCYRCNAMLKIFSSLSLVITVHNLDLVTKLLLISDSVSKMRLISDGLNNYVT
jgi:hypothetical protein